MRIRESARRNVAVCIILALTASTAVVHAESKSAREWLKQFQAEAKAKTPDPEMALLEWGCVMHSYGEWVAQGDQKPAWDAFEKFWKERGEKLLDKFRRGEEFTEEEARYEWLVRCSALGALGRPAGLKGKPRKATNSMQDDFHIYGLNPTPKSIYDRHMFTTIYLGRMTLKKGYSGLPLNEDDITALREYNFVIYLRSGAAQYGPKTLRLMRRTHFNAGESFPNFYIKRFDSVITDPKFSDMAGDKWDWTARMRPLGIKMLLQTIDGYYGKVRNDGQVGAHPKAALDGWADVNDKSYIRLSDFHAKKRPLVLLKTTTQDFCWPVRWMAGVESIYQAYKDKVDFYLVSCGFTDGGDLWPQQTFFGQSLNCPLTDDFSKANSLKVGYMRHPNVTIPGLLDNDASSFSISFPGTFIMFDVDGKVAYNPPSGNSALYGQGEDQLSLLNDLEYEIRALLENEGKCDKTRGPHYRNEVRSELAQRCKDGVISESSGQRLHYISYHKWPSGSWTFPLWFSGHITNIDWEAMQLTVKIELQPVDKMYGYKFNLESKGKAELDKWGELNQRVLEKWVKGGDKARTYVFDIDDTVELFLNGLPAKFATFRVGDRIGGRIGFLPDEMIAVANDPTDPDSKNYSIPKITTTPEGFSRVTPEHLRVSRPIAKGASQFIRERMQKADDIIKSGEAMKREAKKREKKQKVKE